ncbi:hypothetical protein [Hornefia butyriciproducens]|uniref:hypothetical protein n=1 Tax=Hornefia butyriciproducens TaxID=2652293 RepID=UPI002A915822|nr:hypothetical protein [Hornefia butyriciproducens]MDY5423691.1 hypothetical protein [Hornefia butyriciproducens]
MEQRKELLRKYEIGLAATGISGALVIAFFFFVNFFTGPMVSAEGVEKNSLYGLDVIIFSAAIGCAYAFICLLNMRALDPKTVKEGGVNFRIQSERYISGSQGVMICNIFTFVYWGLYTITQHIRFYVDENNKIHDFTFYNRIWLALMLIAVIFSVIAMLQGIRLKYNISTPRKKNKKKKTASKKR